jgi:uncharacterized membrane protein
VWHGVIRSDPRQDEGWDAKKLKDFREKELIAFFETNEQVNNGSITYDEKIFSINPGETKEFKLDIFAREDSIPGLYLGKILFISENFEKEILLALEINSVEPLFDISLTIPEYSLERYSGEKVYTLLEIFNLGKLGTVDVLLEYTLKNFEGETILIREDSMAVETQASRFEILELPKNLKPGNYFISVKVKYDGKFAVSSDQFSVLKKNNFYEGVFFIIFILLLVLFFLIIKHRKLKKHLLIKKNSKKKKKKVN